VATITNGEAMEGLRWNKARLYELVRSRQGGNRFIIVSNREPYVHTLFGQEVRCERPVSGLTEALDPVARASGGTWVAQGSGDADRRVVDEAGRVAVPPEHPEYTLRRVWLSEADVEGYYRGFANECLWPLCHVAFTPPRFSRVNWDTYRKVNRLFADAVIEEAGGRPAVVLVQDYHFALLPRYLRERDPGLKIGQFWHIPWPAYEIFRTCPWCEDILDGLLGSDLLGFHTPSFCRNFIEAVTNTLEARTDLERSAVTYRGGTTTVASFPISVDFDSISEQADGGAVTAETARLSAELGLAGKTVGLGMDRLDYTKGIPERLLALDRLLEDNPAYRGRVVFIQAGMPSRTRIDTYQRTGERIDGLIETINAKYAAGDWRPVVAMNRQLSYDTLNALRRLARFCVVSSLHDGMNLVAKEYVAARSDGDGVLVLSRFAGASAELPEALPVNPFDTEDFAARLKEAIEMPEGERRRRMKRMRETVAVSNIYKWGADLVARLISMAGA
jgi:alpha,alpha-trehalose-phosphate synthase [UDP-forming]